MKRWIAASAVCALVLVAPASAATDTSKYRDHIKVAKLVKHLQALQDIADANGGTRASGTPGFTASVDYVAGKLRDKGFRVTIQDFQFPFFEQLARPKLEQVSPTAQTYVETTDFFTMTYSGSGDVTRNVQAVDTNATPNATSTSGSARPARSGITSSSASLS